MAVALSTLRTQVQTELKDTSASSFTSAQIDKIINRALKQLSKDTDILVVKDGIIHTKNSPKITANGVPWRLKGAWWEEVPLDIHTLEEIQDDPIVQMGGTPASRPTKIFWGESNSNWILYPSPNADANSTTIAANVAASGVVDVQVTDLTKFTQNRGRVIITTSSVDEELEYHTKQSTAPVKLLGCTRAEGLTAAAAHSNGDTIKYCHLTVQYSYVHPTLSADGDNMYFPDDYEEIVVVKASELAHRIRRRYQEMAVYQREYIRQLDQYSRRGRNLSGSDFIHPSVGHIGPEAI